jgi:hypothetical protein
MHCAEAHYLIVSFAREGPEESADAECVDLNRQLRSPKLKLNRDRLKSHKGQKPVHTGF